jgi:Zn-dependent oligopeptidase
MQPSQMKEHFSGVKQRIENAALLCQTTADVPDNVRSRLGELDREANEATRILEQEGNENKIRHCIDRLEKLGDRVVDACASVKVDEQVEIAVRQAHDAISNLKHRLH